MQALPMDRVLPKRRRGDRRKGEQSFVMLGMPELRELLETSDVSHWNHEDAPPFHSVAWNIQHINDRAKYDRHEKRGIDDS